MAARIVPLVPAEADDELLGRVWELRQWYRYAVPDEPVFDRADEIRSMRTGPRTARKWYWIAPGEGTAVDGFAGLIVRDGSVTAYLFDLLVAPHARRRGIGRALLSTVADQARAAGAKHLVGNYLDGSGQGLVRAAGARDSVDRIRRSVLTLPLRTTPVPPVPGYRVVSWVGATPDELLDSFAEACNAINDAPHDAAIADDLYTPERIRDMEQRIAGRGADMRVTVALDGAGTVAGYTMINVSRDRGQAGFTDDTAVVAAHRRRGIALWIKDVSLRALGAERPDVPSVITDNEVTNAPMIAVNDRLGFVETSIRIGAVLDL
jgi:GNAT superfamily N-acetyltransferase